MGTSLGTCWARHFIFVILMFAAAFHSNSTSRGPGKTFKLTRRAYWLLRDSNEKTPARIKIQSFFGASRGGRFGRFFFDGGPLGRPWPSMGPLRPFLGALGPSFGRVWVHIHRPPNLAFHMILFSAARVLSWLSWPPSGCLGPVPLALRGRSEGPVSLAHGTACSVFFVNDAFFATTSFFQPQGGSKGVLE